MTRIFANTVCVLILCGGLFAAAPLAVDDLHLTAANTSRICYPLVNDSDADGDVLSLQSFDSASARGGTITDNGDGTLTYSPPSGFAGLDTFGYTATDGGSSSSGTVSISVNAAFDAEAARTAILNGVSTLADPGGASGCVAYGPTACSIGHYGGENRSDPIVAASTLGNGRVLAMPDHQWLRMNTFANSGDTGQYYLNALAWLTGTTSKDIKVVAIQDNNEADVWLTSQGFTNVVKSSNYATELADADVLVGWLGSSLSQTDVDSIIDFTRNGGALFLADYGIGYIWWWDSTGLVNAPGNRVLRQAGIGFAKEGGGSLDIDRSSGQTTSEDVVGMLEDSSGYSTTDLDIGGTVMSRIFDILPEGDNLLARLDVEFYKRIDSIYPSLSSAVSDSFEKSLLRRESSLLLAVPIDEITTHRTTEPVYGIVPEGAPRVTQVFNFNITEEGINTRGNDSVIWLSTGLYAAPGEIVTLTVDPAVTSLGMKVKLSGDWNNISARDSYLRMPFGTSRAYVIDSTSVQAASAFGGLIYITIPKNTIPGAFDVTIENAVEAPYFVLGQDTNEDWLNTLRDRPAPWAELVSGNMIISLPTYMISDLDKAEELMTFWHEGVAAQDDLVCWTGRRTRPMRMYSMIQTAWGSGYAGYPIGGQGWDFGDYEGKELGYCWGAYHETGHWHQSKYWKDDRTGEVTVNVFTMRAIEAVCDSGIAASGWKSQWDPASRVSMYQSSGGFDAASLSERLVMFTQLKVAFGWGAYKNLSQSYLDDEISSPGSLPTNDQEEWDQLMQRFSMDVGYDLSPFFVDWAYGVSQPAIDSLSDLPEWNMLETVTDYYSAPVGASVTIVNPADNDYSFEGSKTGVSMGTAENGVLTDNGDGTWMYTPNGGFEGIETISYTVQNGYGNTFTGTVEITFIAIIERERIAYDGFEGTDGTDVDGTGSGTGWAGNWTETSAFTPQFRYSDPGNGFSILETTGQKALFLGNASGSSTRYSRSLTSAVTVDASNPEIWVSTLVEIGSGDGDVNTGRGIGIELTHGGTSVVGMGKKINNSFGIGSSISWSDNWVNSSVGSGSIGVRYLTLKLFFDGTDTIATVYVADGQTQAGLDFSDVDTFAGTATLTISGAVTFDGVNLYGYHGSTTSNSIDEIVIERQPEQDPPTPDPMTFATDPYAAGTATISMTATTATDVSGVEYYFTCTAGGGNDSGWQGSASYEDTGLLSDIQYSYTVKARDLSAAYNETAESSPAAVVIDLYDGKLGMSDFAFFAAQWLDVDCGFCEGTDLTGDGNTNIDDLLVFGGNWLN